MLKILAAALFAFALTLPSLRAEDAPKKEEKKEAKGEAEKKYALAEIGCYRCCFKAGKECAPACRIDGKIYILKVLDTADEKTKKLIETCSGKLEAMKAKVVGKAVTENDQHWYYVGELLMAE